MIKLGVIFYPPKTELGERNRRITFRLYSGLN